MNHKTDMQAALQACVDVLLHDGVPIDPTHPKRIALDAAEVALASRPDAQANGWLRDGSLLYRLADDSRPQNRDEINVTMADGSRLSEDRERRAKQILSALIGVSDAQADERGAFEAWVKSEYGYSTERYELGGYKRPELNMWWTTWQARVAAPQAAAQGVAEDTRDAVSKALRRAWQLGQTYWQQADSESWAQQNKSDETQKKFDALVDETRAMLAAAPSPHREQVGEAQEKLSNDDWLDDARRAIRVYAHACRYDKSGVPAASAEIERLLAAGGPSTSRDRGEQDCPHGVDDGACKQCYGEAVRGGQVAAYSHPGCEVCACPKGYCQSDRAPDVSAPTKAEVKCKACNGNDGDMPCAYPEGRADCLRNASAPTLGETVQGKPMATTAEFDVAIETLRHVIECLRNTGRYTDEEGEATDFLESLLHAHLSAPQPQAAEPPTHWRDKPQNIALLAVERGDPVDCDGTFACPICGKGEPHQHSSDEIAKFRITQRQHKVIDALLSKADALIVSYTNVSGNHHGQLDSAIEMVRNARALLSKGE